MNAVYEGVFDARSQYSFSVFSQTVVVLFTILSTILLHSIMGGYAIALGYFIGTIASFLIKVVYFKPQHLLLRKQKIDRDEVVAFYKVFIPVGVTIMVGQINLTVNFFFAGSFGKGVISYLNYAFRLVSYSPGNIRGYGRNHYLSADARAISVKKMKNALNQELKKGITFGADAANSDDCYYDLLYERHCNDCLPARWHLTQNQR